MEFLWENKNDRRNSNSNEIHASLSEVYTKQIHAIALTSVNLYHSMTSNLKDSPESSSIKNNKKLTRAMT